MIKLGADQIREGKPVSLDCYDIQGRLILKVGSVIESKRQAEFLLERGLFGVGENGKADGTPKMEQGSSPFQKLREYYERLEQILLENGQLGDSSDAHSTQVNRQQAATQQLTTFLDGKSLLNDAGKEPVYIFPGQILGLAKDLQSLCESDPDATLGAIHLGGTGARYSISRALNRALMCELLARRRGIPKRNRVQLLAAALTCDLSIMQMQDELTAQEEALWSGQKQAIADHPMATVELLNHLGAADPSWTNAVAQHHEFPNGSGYPAKLEGKVISPWARVLTLADTYTAMVSARAYRKALSSKVVVRKIFLRRGMELDEELSLLLVKEIGVFPPGAFVRLQSGEIAVVTRRTVAVKAPEVMVLVGPRGAALTVPLARTTDNFPYAVVEVVDRDTKLVLDLDRLWGYVGS